MSQAPSIGQHLTHKARNQIAVGMVLETSTAKMEVTQCQVRNKILRMRTIPNTEPATASRDSNNNPLQRMATATGNSNHFKGGQKPEPATVSRIGNNSQGTASTAVTGRRATWKYERMRLGNMKENDLVIIKNQVTSNSNNTIEVRFSYED